MSVLAYIVYFKMLLTDTQEIWLLLSARTYNIHINAEETAPASPSL